MVMVVFAAREPQMLLMFADFVQLDQLQMLTKLHAIVK